MRVSPLTQPPSTAMEHIAPAASSSLARWARVTARRSWRVVGVWVVLLVLLGVGAATFGGQFADTFTIPGAESQRATDLLKARFPSQAGDSATVVFRAQAGVEDPAVKGRVEALLAQAARLPEVTEAVSPFVAPGQISADGTIAFARVQYATLAPDVAPASINALTTLIDNASGDGLTIEVGGEVIANNEQVLGSRAELVGVAAAVVILLFAFGSVIAMGLPIITALVGLGIGFLGILLATAALDISTFTPAFAAMIGIGVGIDYALFIVTRFRESLAAGLTVEDAVVTAVDTSGRAVIFAGIVVVIALLGLFAIGIPFVAALGVAAALVVGGSVLVAITLLPALLSLVGNRIDRWRIPGLHAVDGHNPHSWSYRWSHAVQRRPIIWMVASMALLLTLAAPALDLRLGFSDNGNKPTSLHSRRAYDLLKEGFGPGFNGPLLVVAERNGGLDQSALERLSSALGATPGVVAVAPASVNPAGDTAIVAVIPATAPQDQATNDLVNVLRNDVISPALAGTDTRGYVGGGTAAFVDIGSKITARMPLFFAIVIGLSFLLLMAVFRSVVIPLKAALMNLLSIGAAYGVLVAVFQWGWAAGVFGVGATGPIESFLPMMLFAILFGLSMDYEVFLLSRIREEYLRTGSSAEGVASGLALTARVITAAAAIMVMVFVSFVFGGERIIKEFGLGLATAILVDATVVRMVLVPATMNVLGDLNWWFPRWLDRVVPRLNVEGAAPARIVPAPTRAAVD